MQTTIAWPGELRVHSEIGALRHVVLHTPGRELELMAPSNHDALLFDDILMLHEAREEHGVFVDMLRALGIHVLAFEEQLACALTTLPDDEGRALDRKSELQTDEAGRWDIQRVVWEVERLHHETARGVLGPHWLPRYSDELRADLLTTWRASGAAELARKLIEGFPATPTMANYYDGLDPFLMTPIPNLLFMRDPASVVGNGVIISAMAKPARRREALLTSLVFRGLGRHQPVWFDTFARAAPDEDQQAISVEGGDVLVIHDHVLAIGVSERTSAEALTLIAERLFKAGEIDVVVAVLMPSQRVTMHLDTIFNMISERECLIYPPMIDPTGVERVRVIRLAKGPNGEVVASERRFLVEAIEEALRQVTGTDALTLRPIFCGGEHLIDQDREQWTDGANVLALAPGVVVGYDRNEETFKALDQSGGYETVSARDVIDKADLRDRIVAAMDATTSGEPRRRFAIAIPGAELSRARGGPRCMTMPLVRDPVRW